VSPTVPFIQVEPTTRCNFSCAFCPGRHLPQRDMAPEVFDAVLSLFPEVKYVQLYGEGEPLLHADFFSMVRKICAKGARVSTVTNGSLLKRNLDEVLSSGLLSLHISIESADPHTFNQIRGGNFEQISESIAFITGHGRDEKHPRPCIGFSMTILKSTIYAVEDVFKTYLQLSMDGGIIVQPLSKMPSYTKNYPGEVTRQFLGDEDIERINLKLKHNKLLKEIQRTRRLEATFFEALRRDFKQKEHGCPWLSRSLFVNVDGHIMPCSMIKDVKGYEFGHVMDTDRAIIIDKRERMRRLLIRGDVPEACNQCRTLDTLYKPGMVHQLSRSKNPRACV